MALSITAGDGNAASQANTQSPQTSAGSGASSSAPSSSVQPGTATALLNSQGGVPLYATVLPTVNLTAAAPAATSATVTNPSNPPKHHVNPLLLSFPVLLLIIAAAWVWAINRSVKSTT